jgi:hypothetical protein
VPLKRRVYGSDPNILAELAHERGLSAGYYMLLSCESCTDDDAITSGARRMIMEGMLPESDQIFLLSDD